MIHPRQTASAPAAGPSVGNLRAALAAAIRLLLICLFVLFVCVVLLLFYVIMFTSIRLLLRPRRRQELALPLQGVALHLSMVVPSVLVAFRLPLSRFAVTLALFRFPLSLLSLQPRCRFEITFSISGAALSSAHPRQPREGRGSRRRPDTRPRPIIVNNNNDNDSNHNSIIVNHIIIIIIIIIMIIHRCMLSSIV